MLLKIEFLGNDCLSKKYSQEKSIISIEVRKE